MDLEATVAKFREVAASGSQILHLATHGLVDTDTGELGGLALAHTEKETGFLSHAELAEMEIHARLVYLSACDASGGVHLAGTGLDSAARAFAVAGVSEVIGPLWTVADEAGKDLAVHFYRTLLNESDDPASALRRAKLALLGGNFPHPYYWSGFQLMRSYN